MKWNLACVEQPGVEPRKVSGVYKCAPSGKKSISRREGETGHRFLRRGSVRVEGGRK